MVHAALRGIGYLVNGPDDIVDGILDCIGPAGTLLAPGHSGQLCDPKDWTAPAAPETAIELIRANMKPFDRKRTPVRNRGGVAEAVFRHPEVARSNHPLVSVLAIGGNAKAYTESHPLHASEGVGSPCYRLYERGGKVLLFGVDMGGCTAPHVAEYIVDCSYLKDNVRNVLVADEDGTRKFVRLARYPGTSDYFTKLQPHLMSVGACSQTYLHDYPIAMFDLRTAVDHSVKRLRDDENYFQHP